MDVQHQDEPKLIRVTCARAIAPILQQEVERLGLAITSSDVSGVETTGTLADCIRLNLHLRTGLHVLYLIAEFTAHGPEDLYRQVQFLPWETLIPEDGYLSVVSRVDTMAVDHSAFVNQKVKDAIVDRIADRCGRRPDSGPRQDRCVVSVYWRGSDCKLYLDTSGRKLSDRGYRKIPHKAPLQETLAAAILLAAGYEGGVPLVNPMCGSGTLAIEAALIAAGRAPGLLRTNFGFQHLKGFDPAAFGAIRRAAQKAKRDGPPPPIIATDIDPKAIRAAEQNAKTAGVDWLIRFAVCDFAATPLPPEPGVIVINPEYGERMGNTAELAGVYRRIGDFFKQQCSGHTGYVFTGNLDLAKHVGLRTAQRMVFYNARIECRLLKYELYTGSRRLPKPE